MTTSTRRGLFGLAGGAALLASAPRLAAAQPFTPKPEAKADDEAYWADVAAQFDTPAGDVIQLENGQFGAMATPVRAAYERITQKVNRQTTLYTRSSAVAADLKAVRAKVAALLGVDVDEVVMTRGTTESMQTLIGGYNRLEPGDAVLYADLDYDAMQTTMEALARRRGVRVIKIGLPEPATRQNLIDAYDQALRANPAVRMMLLTHLSHRTGLIPPVREIADMARARGVDVILDGGHALGQKAFDLRGLGVDFVGLNLHKWIGAPIGVGVVYIRKDRIADIDVALSSAPSDSIEARVHTGTFNYAVFLAVGDAIDFHNMIGVQAKERRLMYLRGRWAEAVRANPKVEVLTPNDPAMHAGLTSFRIKGRTSEADNLAVRKALLERYNILTVERMGPTKGGCIRVTPHFINTPDQCDRLAKAIGELAAQT